MIRLDIRRLIQPFSFLIVSKAFKEMQNGKTMEILLSGSAAVTDLLKVLPAASYAVVSMDEKHGADTGVRLRLKKNVTQRRSTESIGAGILNK